MFGKLCLSVIGMSSAMLLAPRVQSTPYRWLDRWEQSVCCCEELNNHPGAMKGNRKSPHISNHPNTIGTDDLSKKWRAMLLLSRSHQEWWSAVRFSPFSAAPQALTLSNLDHWPRGPVDLRSYWPEGQYIWEVTGPLTRATDNSYDKTEVMGNHVTVFMVYYHISLLYKHTFQSYFCKDVN